MAALLAADGRKVLLLEAAERPGGYARRLELGGATFCAQVQYLFMCGETEVVDRLLRVLGIRDEIEFLRLDPEGYDVISIRDERYRIPNGHTKHRERLVRQFPAAEDSIWAYFDLLTDVRDEILQMPGRVRVTTMVTAPFYYPHALRYSTWTLQEVFDHVGLPPRLQAILAGQCGDIFAPPEKASFLMHTSLVSAYDQGAFYPRRHMHYFIERVAQVVEDAPGSEARYGEEVVEILHERGRAVGVRTASGEEFRGRRLISNLDPSRTAQLAGFDEEDARGWWRRDYEYSPAPFNLYLVLEGIDLRDYGFGNFNFWQYPHEDINAIYQAQVRDHDLSDPWFFVSSPTLMSPEPGLAPEGVQTLHLVTSACYEHFRQGADPVAFENVLLDRLEQFYVPGLRGHIRTARVHTPLDNERLFRAPQAAAYGAVLTPETVNRHRHPRQSPLEGLFLINATAGYPGVGGMATMAEQLHRQLREED
jgi:all-trans-retinol 13,14-reductase